MSHLHPLYNPDIYCVTFPKNEEKPDDGADPGIIDREYRIDQRHADKHCRHQ